MKLPSALGTPRISERASFLSVAASLVDLDSRDLFFVFVSYIKVELVMQAQTPKILIDIMFPFPLSVFPKV